MHLRKVDDKPTLVFDLDETLIHCNQKNGATTCEH